jgi:hypothetical protein
MKATIIISFVVVVLGLNWPKQQPIANTTTDIISTDSFSPRLLTASAGMKKQNLPSHTTGYYTSQHLHIERPADKHRYKNLQLYPVYASSSFINHHRALGPYLTLKEGLTQQKLIITELSAPDILHADTTCMIDENASVNNLFIENISSDTILVLGGEVIQGGKQDRMIAQDFLVPPHSGKVDIAVYCVEHGRWDEPLLLQFNVTVGFAPNSVREATVIDEEEVVHEMPPSQQSEVWKEVAELQEDAKMVSPTSALAEVMDDDNIRNVIQPYQDFFTSVPWSAQVIGVVAVMGDEIVGCDLFAQHNLFMKYYPDLVRSYCDRPNRDSKTEVLSYKEVRSFFTEVFKSEASLDRRLNERGTQLKHKNERLHMAVY